MKRSTRSQVSRSKSGSFRVDLEVGATPAGAGRPWLACPLRCTPVGFIALEVENGRVDLTDEFRRAHRDRGLPTA
jgi:hypothetical protein